MKKLFVSLLLVSFGAFAANDDLANRIYSFCQSNQGRVTYSPTATVNEATGETCVRSSCALDSREGTQECNVNIDSQSIPAGCVRAVLQTCGRVVTSGGSQSGSQSGAQSGAQSGSQSGAQSGSQSGAQSGVQSGSQSGSQSGAQSGCRGGNCTGEDQRVNAGSQGGGQGGSGSGDGYYCVELGDYIYEDHPCYNSCKRTSRFLFWGGDEGLERKSCRDCLGIRRQSDGVYVRGSGSTTIRLNGGSQGGGNVGSGVGGGVGGVYVQSGAQGGGQGGGDGWTVVVVDGISYRIPSHCVNSDGSVKSSCRGYLSADYRIGGGSGRCEYSSDARGCVGEDDYTRIVTRNQTGVDCVNCQAGSRGGQHWLSGVAEIVGAIAPPLAQFGIAYVQSDAYRDANRAWAGAAEAGFEQCRLSQQDYLNYLQTNQLPGMTPEQQAAQRCNGYQLGGFAGLGGMYGNGYGGFGNPYIGGGYTGGFLGGMMGPYGMYNPYGLGGIVGGAVGGGMVGGVPGGMVGGIYAVGGMAGGGYVSGMAGGYVSGMAGGYVSGMQGGYVGGAYQVGGIAGGYVSGMQGGYVGGGYVGGGYAGGYVSGMQGGYVGGMYTGGGMVGGAVGSIVGGFNGGFQGGGFAGGFNGGFQGGGFAGGFNGGFQGGGFAGGFNGGVGGIYAAGGINGGYYPGGAGGVGGWGSGTVPWGGNGSYWGQGGAQAALYQNQQAAMYGSNLQQQALANQFGMAASNLGSYAGAGGYGGYGAGYAPGNLGASLGGYVGFGFSG